MATVSVLGGGAWGTALAMTAVRAGSETMIWDRDESVLRDIAEKAENSKRLPGIPLDPGVVATFSLEDATQANVLVLAIPAQSVRSVVEEIAPYVNPDSYFVICAKGIESRTGLLMNEVIGEILPDQAVAVLSGPSFAAEVATGLPAAVTLASETLKTSAWLSQSFSSPTFRAYPCDDIIGAQLGGALKNVLAIAAGIVDGRRLGHNARAAIVTRGLKEITQLGLAKGAKAETFQGLSGVGDILLTCLSDQSRNRQFGLQIGAGKSLEEITQGSQTVVEGLATVASVRMLAASLDVELPICFMVEDVLTHGKDIERAIEDILMRPMRPENARNVKGAGSAV